MSKVKVLVFPCGSENALEIHKALRYSIHVELYGASSIEDAGRFHYENYIGGLPNISEESFDSEFSKLIDDLNIDVVFSTHDTVAEYLSKINIKKDFYLVNGNKEATNIARKKSLTYELFSTYDWCPNVYDNLKDITSWPIIIKPDLGQGGQGVTLVKNEKEFNESILKIDNPVCVEYLPGEELTVDCFSDRNKKLIWIGPRTRERVKAGISMKSNLLQPCEEVSDIAEVINNTLPLRGPWFFQLKKSIEGKWKLLEISVRIAGTMVAQRARGVNLPLMAIQDFLGRDLMSLPMYEIDVVERNLATRTKLNYHFDKVYIDLDDTIIIDGYAVPNVLSFLYEMKKEQKELLLITRHEFDISNTLKNVHILPELFDHIIHITDKSPKSNYVKNEKAIFIDNHFPERLDVYKNCGIPVFDVDFIEFLLK